MAEEVEDWNTIPTSERSRASAFPSGGSGRPSKTISPEWIGSSRLIVRQSVDVPDPEGPMTTTTSPVSTARSMSRSTWSVPKCWVTPSRVTSGPPGSGVTPTS